LKRIALVLAVMALMLAMAAPAVLAHTKGPGIPLSAAFDACKVKKNETRTHEDETRLRVDIDCRGEAANEETAAGVTIPAEFQAENCRVKKDEVRSEEERVRIKVDVECEAEEVEEN
jgi:hypothetical protein